MHIVSALLRRTLLQQFPIAVEGIGTVRTTLRRARLLPGQRLEPPRRLPEVVATQPGDLPLPEVVATELAIDLPTAYALCDEWREEGYRAAAEGGMPRGSFVFEGVGAVRNDAVRGGVLLVDPAFLEMLNPLSAEPLVVATATKRPAAADNELQTAPDRRGRRTGGGARRGGMQPARQARPRGPRGKNPHRYTVSFLAIAVVAVAAGYLGYYLWRHADWLLSLLNF